MSNLQFIQSAEGYSVSSIDLTNCFSEKYDNYMISLVKGDQTQNNYTFARYISESGLDTSSNYDSAGQSVRSYASFGEMRFTNQTSIKNIAYRGSERNRGDSIVYYVYNPFDSSKHTFGMAQASGHFSSGLFGVKHISVHKVAARMTGMRFFPGGGSYDSVKVNCYGILT